MPFGRRRVGERARTLNASTSSTASPRRQGAPLGIAPSCTETESAMSTVNAASRSSTSTANEPRQSRPSLRMKPGLERGRVPHRRHHLVGLDRGSQAERERDVTFVHPCVPHRVAREQPNRKVAGRRLRERHPTVVVEAGEHAEKSVVTRHELVEHFRRGERLHRADHLRGCCDRIEADEIDASEYRPDPDAPRAPRSCSRRQCARSRPGRSSPRSGWAPSSRRRPARRASSPYGGVGAPPARADRRARRRLR